MKWWYLLWVYLWLWPQSISVPFYPWRDVSSLWQLPTQAHFVEPVGCSVTLWVSPSVTLRFSQNSKKRVLLGALLALDWCPLGRASIESPMTLSSHWTWHRVPSMHPVHPLNALLAESHRILKHFVFSLPSSTQFFLQGVQQPWGLLLESMTSFGAPSWHVFV